MTSDLSPPPVVDQPKTGPPVLLRRSTSDKVVAGVAGGLGRYLGIDPVILRIAFVLLAVSGGSGVLLYIIAWLAIPEEKPGDPLGKAPHGARLSGRMVVGGAIIVVGSLLLMSQLFPDIDQYFWPVAVIIAGAFVIMGGRR